MTRKREKLIILSRLVRLHGQKGNDWNAIQIEFPRKYLGDKLRCRPYLKTIYKKYLRECIKKYNGNITERGDVLAGISFVNNITADSVGDSAYLKRS
jgi:hypothetical protein